MKQYFFIFYFLFLFGFSENGYSQLTALTYKDGTVQLNGYKIIPKKINSKLPPGILILPAWKGIDAHAKATAEELEKLGYLCVIADIYGEGNYPTNTEEAAKNSSYYKQNYLAYQKRIQLALEQLILSGADPNQLAVIGFCFGGTGALEAARANLPVKGVVSFHGGLAFDHSRVPQKIEPKILVCHGAADFFVPKEEVLSFQEEMTAGGADWQLIYYANAVHSFTDPAAGNDPSKGAAYNEKAANRSWKHMELFLKELFNKE